MDVTTLVNLLPGSVAHRVPLSVPSTNAATIDNVASRPHATTSRRGASLGTG